jgi:hypothetical protein
MTIREVEPQRLPPTSTGQREPSDHFQESAAKTPILPPAPAATVGDVLDRSELYSKAHKIHSILNEIAQHFGVEDIARFPLDRLSTQKSLFMNFLKHKRRLLKDRKHIRYALDTLLREARALGWEADQHLTREWHSIRTDAEKARCGILVKYFAGIGVQPSNFTRDQIETWINQRVIAQELTFWSAWEAATRFTNVLLQHGYSNVDPIAAARLNDYGIPLKEIVPIGLRQEIERLITYRTNPADGTLDELDEEDELRDVDDSEDIPDPTVPPRVQIRQITARSLEGSICRLYGFLKGKRPGLNCLDQLFERKSLERYRLFLLLEHKIEPTALRNHFNPLLAAAAQYPALKNRRTFLQNFMKSIPNEPDWRRRQRMSTKCLRYELLQAIPEALRAERCALNQMLEARRQQEFHKKAVAKLAMEEFLMRWLLELPWRARNICECRLHHNLFKGSIRIYDALANDPRVKEQGPEQEYWQYKFSKEECKGKYAIHRLLPHELIGPLEEYLKFRNDLTLASEEALFVNGAGHRMGHSELYCIICGITLRFGGKRASTKVLRDMFAFRYLLTNTSATRFDDLAELLWHRFSETTRRYYATQWNHSVGARIAEAFSKERQARRKGLITSQAGLALPERVLWWISSGAGIGITIFVIAVLLWILFYWPHL